MNSCLAFVLLEIVFLACALGADPTMTVVDDGANPIDDGETQENKTVTLKCEGTITFTTTIRMIFQRGTNSESEIGTDSGAQVPFKDNPKYVFTPSCADTGACSLELIIKGISISDAGDYFCRVTKKSDTTITGVSAKKKITVYGPLSSMSLAETVVEAEGGPTLYKVETGTHTIKCLVLSGAAPTITFKIDNTNIGNAVVSVSSNSSLFEGKIDYIFKGEDNGKTLSCGATMKTFDEVTTSATLQVTAPPAVTCSPPVMTILVGGNAEFTCTVTGTPLPSTESMEWMAKKNPEILNGLKVNEARRSFAVKSVAVTESDKITVKLSFEKMMAELFDDYTLSVGSLQSTVSLQRTVSEPKPTMNTAPTMYISMILMIAAVVALR